MPPAPLRLSHTSSATSISSNSRSSARRTRTRFTNEQLMMLEQLYHRGSHPTREERENLATDTGMYVLGLLCRENRLTMCRRKLYLGTQNTLRFGSRINDRWTVKWHFIMRQITPTIKQAIIIPNNIFFLRRISLLRWNLQLQQPLYPSLL